jgi:DNA polymerase I-like protein with 3'-5' exonuclease and polymerase domains
VGIKELNDNFDQHGDNQRRLGLPTRLIAKTFLFRLLFGGTAYSYALDPDFSYISSSTEYWQTAIDNFYTKYKGIEQWHLDLMKQAQSTGVVTLPTGRSWKFVPYLKRGELVFPRTQILNYPVQGLGADLMTLARISLWRRITKAKLQSKLISTVHDSILVDGPTNEVDKIVELCYSVWHDIPRNFENQFGIPFDLETRVEIQVGRDWKNMEDAILKPQT